MTVTIIVLCVTAVLAVLLYKPVLRLAARRSKKLTVLPPDQASEKVPVPVSKAAEPVRKTPEPVRRLQTNVPGGRWDWTCPSCETRNAAALDVCQICGAPRP